jgi:hypothetical protein
MSSTEVSVAGERIRPAIKIGCVSIGALFRIIIKECVARTSIMSAVRCG